MKGYKAVEGWMVPTLKGLWENGFKATAHIDPGFKILEY